MGDHWQIVDDTRGFRIQFYNADIDDLGAYLGDGSNADGTWPDGPAGGEEEDEVDKEWNRAHNAAVKLIAAEGLGERARSTGHGGGFLFDSRTEAAKAMRILKTCQKQAKDERPWPEWAVKAAAEGWKAPKGWKP